MQVALHPPRAAPLLAGMAARRGVKTVLTMTADHLLDIGLFGWHNFASSLRYALAGACGDVC